MVLWTPLASSPRPIYPVYDNRHGKQTIRSGQPAGRRALG
jgi:hypothetical protein